MRRSSMSAGSVDESVQIDTVPTDTLRIEQIHTIFDRRYAVGDLGKVVGYRGKLGNH